MLKPRYYPKNFNKKQWLVVAVSAVAIVTIGALIWIQFFRPSDKAGEPTAITEQEYTERSRDIASTFRSGNDEQALSQIDQTLANKELSQPQKISLLEQKAAAYVRQDAMDEAIAVYRQSETLQADGRLSVATAQGLMYIYYERSNNAKAADYCRKLIATVKVEGTALEKAQLPEYKAFLRSLEGES